jgi:hypothetical protein
VIAAAAAAAIINQFIGLNRLTFVSLAVIFVAAILFFIFSQIQKVQEPGLIVRLSGQVIVLVSVLAFTLFIATSFAFAFTCWPPLFAYLYGVEKVCK